MMKRSARQKKQDFGEVESNALEQFVSNHRITRREFIQFAGAIGITAATANVFWSKKAMAAPKRGGILRAGLDGGASTDTFDPRKAIGPNHITTATSSIFDTLIRLDPTTSPIPGLAENWEVGKDGKTWHFKLRKGVEFHNGKSLSAKDVVSTYAYLNDEASGYVDGKNVLGSLAEIKADGDYVVLIQKEANADLPTMLAAWGMNIWPAGEGEIDWKNPVGTGPYRLESFEPGLTIRLKRYTNHYRDDEGFFDEVKLINVNDPVARANGLRSKSFDIITRPDPKTAKFLGKVDGISLVEGFGNQQYTMPMRTDRSPFTDVNVRLAIKYAINREEFLKKVLGGFGYIGNDHPIGRGQRYFNHDLPQRELDPEKAKYYLKKAGLTKLDVELSAAEAAFSGAVDAAVLISESAKKAGINVKVSRTPDDGYWSEVWMKHPWCFSYFQGRVTEDWAFTAIFISTSKWNESYWKNERFDRLVEQARGEQNEDTRRAMYYELQEIVHNDGGVTIPVFASFLHAASDRLGHGEVSGISYMDYFQLARKWWFKS
jgi:peptide/nickel transport system substrate-binding protein